MKYAIVKSYGTIALSGAEQAQAEETIKAYGDIVGFTINLAVDTTLGTGVLGSGACAWNVLSKFTVKNKASDSVLDFSNISYGKHDIELAGNMLNMRLRGTNAKAISNLALDTNGDGSGNVFLPCYISTDDQPASLSVTFNTLSGILSTVGTGASNVTLSVGAVYQDHIAGQPSIKTKIYNVTGIASGDNNIEKFLPNGVKITATGLFSANLQSYVTKLVFSSAGATEFDNVTPSELVALEGSLYSDYTHKTGLVAIPHAPFFKTDVTKLVATYSTGENVRVFHTID